MKILNFGSINIDYVYEVLQFVQPGATIASQGFQTYIGGKGCNQSVAIAKAGVEVFHAGNISDSGIFIKNQLEKWGVNTQFINNIDTPTGHAIIQVDENGENAIIIYGGANQNITEKQIDNTLKHFDKGDFLLLQNEINHISLLIKKAKEKGMKIIFNPAPMTESVLDYPLNLVDIMILNETEATELSKQNNLNDIIKQLKNQFPNTFFILTLGEKGSISFNNEEELIVKAQKVQTIDTTAAGDTFIGYFIAGVTYKMSNLEAIQFATKAAAKTVSKKGGAVSIPFLKDLQE